MRSACETGGGVVRVRGGADESRRCHAGVIMKPPVLSP